jgi:hypothetical protein
MKLYASYKISQYEKTIYILFQGDIVGETIGMRFMTEWLARIMLRFLPNLYSRAEAIEFRRRRKELYVALNGMPGSESLLED